MAHMPQPEPVQHPQVLHSKDVNVATPNMNSTPSPSDSKKRQSRFAATKDTSANAANIRSPVNHLKQQSIHPSIHLPTLAKRGLFKCPICKEHIDLSQYDDHYLLELRRLQELDATPYESSGAETKGKRGAAVAARKHIAQVVSSKKTPSLTGHEQTLSQLRKKRAQRRAALRDGNEGGWVMNLHSNWRHFTLTFLPLVFNPELPQSCFICNEILYGDSTYINSHIDGCLADGGRSSGPSRREAGVITGASTAASSRASRGGSTADEEDGIGWAEYEWAGQTRVRVTSLLEGGYRGVGFAITKKDEDVDDDVDVEDDGAAVFGEAQFAEKDILVNEPDEDEESLALREMVSGRGERRTTEADNGVESPPPHRSDFEATVSEPSRMRPLAANSTAENSTSHVRLVIESLKSRIKQLETSSRAAPKCLICLEPYTSPLVSVVCWHVHCEQCWLRTLGAKKLCPQCQKITGAADLRRVYL
ncbi:hypothetical protein BC937DRAFT_89162 [Endogone sp. FLAS-F59071]|nr:hypothetical protein BC937DRAFT_89162 [Endogone sp. FLAS-F59071]|eukprot:RUS18089.1 hypothetical protein BC937DRAFT_89162 [Endogone sp. FLAS-F59071]